MQAELSSIATKFTPKQKNLLLFKYMMRTSDLVFPLKHKNEFIKNQIRSEFKSKKNIKKEEHMEKFFNRGHQVLTFMMMLYEQNSISSRVVYRSEETLSKGN
jgi:hypothetical protein